MARYDHLLEEDYEDKIIGGDWAVGDADEDNVAILIELPKGHIKNHPLTGINSIVFLNGTFGFEYKKEIREQLKEDGYTTNLIYKDPETEEITVDFT